MYSRDYYSLQSNFGNVNISPADYIVQDLHIEQKFLQKFIIPINSMVFLISEEDDSFTYSFIETDYTIFKTREKIESIKYGHPTGNHEWCCYAETHSMYIILPSIEIIKKRVSQTGGIFNIIR